MIPRLYLGTDGRTDKGKTVYPLRWSGGIIQGYSIHRFMHHVFQISPFHSTITHHKGILISEYCTQLWITWTHKNLPWILRQNQIYQHSASSGWQHHATILVLVYSACPVQPEMFNTYIVIQKEQTKYHLVFINMSCTIKCNYVTFITYVIWLFSSYTKKSVVHVNMSLLQNHCMIKSTHVY